MPSPVRGVRPRSPTCPTSPCPSVTRPRSSPNTRTLRRCLLARDDARVGIEIVPGSEPVDGPSAGSTGDEHRIVRPDRTARAGQPAEQIRLARATEAVRSPIDDLGRIGCVVSTNAWPVNSTTAWVPESSGGWTSARPSTAGKRPSAAACSASDRACTASDTTFGPCASMSCPFRSRCVRWVRSPSPTVDAGFTGMLLTEGGRTAFSAATAAAVAAPGLELSTGVAVAFPRSPMITAQLAWELQELTGGSFRLGSRYPGSDARGAAVRRRVRTSRATSA